MADDPTQRRLLTAAHENARRQTALATQTSHSTPRAASRKRLRDNARRQAALAALTIELAASSAPQAVLERAVDAAAELLEVHTVAAFLCRADGRGFDVAAARGLAPLEPGAPALSLERSIAGRAIMRGAVEAVENTAPERAPGTVFPRLAGDGPAGAVLAAPIAAGGAEPVGALEVYAAAPRRWPQEDRALLRALAAACAVALRGAREAQAVRDSEARLALQYAVTTVLARSTTLHSAIPALLRTICDQLHWDVGTFWIVDRRDNVLRCHDIWHWPSVEIPAFELRSRQSTFPPGAGLPGRVWASGVPVVIADVATDTTFPRAPLAAAEGLHGAVCFPIVVRDAVHGVMEFFSRDVERLNASLVQAITTLGAQIGQFIERMAAEEALRESEARKGAVLQAALDCIVTIDHQGKVIEFNPAAEQTFGYSRGEAIGREMADLIIPPSLRDQHRTGLARYLATGEGPVLGRRVELPAMRADGTEFPVELTITRIPWDGSPLFTGHIRDITERKRIEETLEASEARFRALTEYSLDAVALIGPDGIITYASPSVEGVLGYTPDELVGRSGLALVRPEQNAQSSVLLDAQVQQPRSQQRRESYVRHKDGSWRWIESVRTNLLDEPGVGALVVNFRDITARKRAEDERAQLLAGAQTAHAEAEAAQQRLAFLAEASNVLAASLDYATTLQSVAQLAVPHIADWCVVHTLEDDGSIHQLALAHVDPAKIELSRELQRRYPPDPDAPQGVPHVLRTGRPEIYPEIPDALVAASARDAQDLEIFRRLRMKSALIVPLLARGRALGAMTFVAAESERRYGPVDLALAEDLARRAALAVDNARLFVAAREDARRKAALAALTADLAAANEPRAVLERAVDAASELLEAHTAAAFLRRADGRGFDAAAARGLAPLEPGAPALSMERSIAGRAVAHGTVEAVEDAVPARAAGTEFPGLAGGVPVGAALAAPIAAGGAAPVGVLEVYAAAPRRWPDEDRALLRALAAACAVALRTARETARARQDAARARTLAELSAALYAAQDPDDVLQRLVRGACNALEASRAVLIRRATPADPVTVTHEYAVPGIRSATELVDVAASRTWANIAAQPDGPLPIAVDDVRDHAELAARWAPVPEPQRPYAILAVPVVEGEQLVGVVVLHHCGGPRRWEPEEIAFVQTLATQLTTALRQRRLLATTQDDARRLAALNRVAEVVIGAPSFGAMCDRALAVLTEVLHARAGVLHVYDETAPPERALRMISWYGISDKAAEGRAALPVGVDVIGQAALRRGPVVAGGLDGAPPEATTAPVHVRLPGLDGRASAPMLVRGRLLGVLTVATRELRTWRDADLTLLQTVANQLAAALEAEELRRAAAAAAAAREADRLKSELLSTVSHELRTPLGAIKGFASGLLHYGHRLDEAERVESLRSIDHAADRLTELIDNLLDLQRLEAGRLTVIHGIVDLAELVTMVVTEMGARAPHHTLELTIAPDTPLVTGDARRLRQVLQNLVENAVKYSPDGGRIAVRLQARPGLAELRVEDEGVGIPPDQLLSVFERFHRVDNSATRRIGGTGLGLAIVRGLVTAHGGTIHAESGGEGQGSAFVVTLPTPQEGAAPCE